MVVFAFSVLDWKYPFWANLVQKFEIVSLSQNLVLRLIWICSIQWWFHFICFRLEIPFLTILVQKNQNFHVTYAFQSESTLYICLNVKKLFARSRREIWSLSNCNWTRTQNHLVRKWTLNHLAKLTKWLSCVLSTYLYGAFDCMFLPCHVCFSEWIHTL